ncbi:MAG: ABC transporter ATP-binding protein [Desulfobacterales bacterium]|nr:MAG: ABC transporter ATP-binding protein [Desulfobacterales bacterium]
MDIIEIVNLSHRFSNGTLGLNKINLSIRKGTFVVIGGLNGSGKTTLLKHLNGLLLPHTGIVKINGVPVSKNLLRARQIVGMVFQDADSQIVGETVYDDVAFGPENLLLNRAEIEKRVSEALTCVGLIDIAEQRPHVLSGGEKRRLTIAGILAMEPQVLVFDEPFSNLDYPGRQQVLEQILSLHASGHTILIATHDLEDVMTYADRLILMKDGVVVKDGSPDKLIDDLIVLGILEPRGFRFEMEMPS